jgi:hypothetical protein
MEGGGGEVQQGQQQTQWARKSQRIYKLCYAILYISNTVIIQNNGLTQPNTTIILNNQNSEHKATKYNYVRFKYCSKCAKIYSIISFM